MNLDKDKLVPLDEVEKILAEVVDRYLIPRFMSKGHEASGQWRQNVMSKEDTIVGTKYTEQLVYGRRPGTFAPIEPLRKWAMVKFGLSPEEATRMAFGLSRNLKENGSRIWQEGGSDLLEVLWSKDVIDFINTKVGNFITRQVTILLEREISNTFKTY